MRLVEYNKTSKYLLILRLPSLVLSRDQYIYIEERWGEERRMRQMEFLLSLITFSFSSSSGLFRSLYHSVCVRFQVWRLWNAKIRDECSRFNNLTKTDTDYVLLKISEPRPQKSCLKTWVSVTILCYWDPKNWAYQCDSIASQAASGEPRNRTFVKWNLNIQRTRASLTPTVTLKQVNHTAHSRSLPAQTCCLERR